MSNSRSGQANRARALDSTALAETLRCYWYLAPVLAVLLGLIVYPFFNGITLSFTNRMVARPGTFVGIKNFSFLFQDSVYRLSFRNSIVITVCAVAAKLVVGMAGAVLLHQKFPMRNLLRALIFLPWAIPGLIAGLSWKWIYNEMSGVLNYLLYALGLSELGVSWLSDPGIAIYSITIASVWQGYPFYIMMFLAGMASIPVELYESARVDGANAWVQFWRITIPSLRDVIAIVVMLSSIWTFNSFYMVYILTGGGPADRTHILPTLAFEHAIRRSNLSLGAAVMVTFVPIFLLLIFFLTKKMLQEESS